MFWRFIHVVVCYHYLFFFYGWRIYYTWIVSTFWIVEICFYEHSGANSYEYVFISHGYIARSVIARLPDNPELNFLRNSWIVFHNSCTILHSCQPVWRFSFFHISCQYLLLSIFFIIIILVSMKWYLIVIIHIFWLSIWLYTKLIFFLLYVVRIGKIFLKNQHEHECLRFDLCVELAY